MKLTNQQHGEIIFCEFQIKHRKQTLLELDADLKFATGEPGSGGSSEELLWKCTQKMQKIEFEIKDFEKRLLEINKEA